MSRPPLNAVQGKCGTQAPTALREQLRERPETDFHTPQVPSGGLQHGELDCDSRETTPE